VSFSPPPATLPWVGLLSRIRGLATESIRIGRDPLVLGRKDCDVVLADESVSRRHAQISREGDDFILEDLGSSNGTHVDGIPIVSCVLRDGDTVQIGQNLYRFERLLERAEAAAGDAR
jgi:pSer/pThr/pTyr-binding forkhead associated (FHA) protein